MTGKTTGANGWAQGIVLCVAMACTGGMSAQALSDTARVYNIGEVVVTGSNNVTGRDLLPYTVSVMDGRQLEATGRTQLLSALSGRVPSLFVSERNIFGFGISNGGSGGIKIRGVGGDPTNAVLMMVDGQPQFAGLYSHSVADFYETEYVERVEVLRGPASVLYGSNAMGGVVNVITRNARHEGVHTTLTSQYGSYNTWQTALTNTVRFGRFSSLVSVGYDRTDGIRDNFDFEQKSVYAKIGYDISRRWQVRADYSLMNFTGNDPVYPRLSDAESTDIYHQNITRGEASLSLSNSYDDMSGCVRMYYSYGNHFVDDPRHFHSLDDRFGVLAYQNFSPWTGTDITLGFDFDTYTGEIPVSGGHAFGDGSLQAQMQTIGRKSITEYSPYVAFSQGLFDGVLTLNGGLRMANSDRFGTYWVPQGGVVVRPGGDWMVKASLAKGYRNPSFREMYLYRMANPELEPESMMNYEVTVGKTFSRYFGFDVTAYFSEGSNMIQTVSMKNVNTGSFRNKGVELSVDSRPTDKLVLNATYSHMYTSLAGLTAAPKNQYSLGVAWQPAGRLSVDAGLRGVGGLYVADGVDRQDYVLVNMKLTYKAMRSLDVFAAFDNMTNAEYTINEGYEMPGFTAMGGVKLRF